VFVFGRIKVKQNIFESFSEDVYLNAKLLRPFFLETKNAGNEIYIFPSLPNGISPKRGDNFCPNVISPNEKWSKGNLLTVVIFQIDLSDRLVSNFHVKLVSRVSNDCLSPPYHTSRLTYIWDLELRTMQNKILHSLSLKQIPNCL